MNVVPQPSFLMVDWWALGAVIALTVGCLALLVLEFLPAGERSSRGGVISLLTLGVSAYAVLRVAQDRRSLFDGMFVHDGMTVFFTVLFCAIGSCPCSCRGTT